jgi:hypothetical protein
MQAVLTPLVEPETWKVLPARAVVVAHGVRIGFGASSTEALGQLTSLLPPGTRRAANSEVDISYTLNDAPGASLPGGPPEFIAHVSGDELVRSNDRAEVLLSLERHLQLHVAEYAPRRVFVHAGVVGWKGQGIVIPGTSYSGKSTLVAAFVRAGATYYSDEYAVIDPTGRVYPYLRPIQLRDAIGLPDRDAAARVPLRNGRQALRVRVVLMTYFRPGAQWRPQPISAGLGMLGLLANTVSARRDPKRALQNLTRMLRGVVVLKGARGEAAAVVSRLLRTGYLAT